MIFIVKDKNAQKFREILNQCFVSIDNSSSRAEEQDNGTWKFEINETIIEKLRLNQINKLTSFSTAVL